MYESRFHEKNNLFHRSTVMFDCRYQLVTVKNQILTVNEIH